MYDLPTELSVTADGPIRLVELNRPEELNSTSEALHAGLAVVCTQPAWLTSRMR